MLRNKAKMMRKERYTVILIQWSGKKSSNGKSGSKLKNKEKPKNLRKNPHAC